MTTETSGSDDPIDAIPPTDVSRHGPYKPRRHFPALARAVDNDPIGNSGP
jgi:hypothetical protein